MQVIFTTCLVFSIASVHAIFEHIEVDRDPPPAIQWAFQYGIDDSLCIAGTKSLPPFFIQNVSGFAIVSEGRYLYISKRTGSDYQLLDGDGSIVVASRKPFGIIGSVIISSDAMDIPPDTSFTNAIVQVSIKNVDHRWADSGLLWIQDELAGHWVVVSDDGTIVAGPFEGIGGFSRSRCHYQKPDGEIGIIGVDLTEIKFANEAVLSGPYSDWFVAHFNDGGELRDEIWQNDERKYSIKIERPVSYEVTAEGLLVGYEYGGDAVIYNFDDSEWIAVAGSSSQKTSWQQSKGGYAFFSDGDDYVLKNARMISVYSTTNIAAGPVRPVFVDDKGWSLHQSDDFDSYFILDSIGNIELQFPAP